MGGRGDGSERERGVFVVSIGKSSAVYCDNRERMHGDVFEAEYELRCIVLYNVQIKTHKGLNQPNTYFNESLLMQQTGKYFTNDKRNQATLL